MGKPYTTSLTSLKPYQAISLPTGMVDSLVCVGDLPSFDYKTSIETVTEEVTKHLEDHPELPGVILMNKGCVFGVIPRERMFERLGHRYGVELFLRKPIIELQKNLSTELYSVSSNTRINEAVHYVLSRPAQFVYEPIVILYDNQDVRLLDVYTLLVSQAYNLENLNNLIRTLRQISSALSRDRGLEKTLDKIMQDLRKVVPYHHAAIFLKESNKVHLSNQRVIIDTPSKPILKNAVFQSILKHAQPIYLEDIRMVPAWNHVSSMGDLRSWMGVPLKEGPRPFGVLSLGRRTLSPFSKDEMDMAQAFGDYIGIALNKLHAKPK
jgi:GAF domain